MSTNSHSTDTILDAIEALLSAIRHENQKWVEISKAGTILYKLRNDEDALAGGGGWLEGIIKAIDIESGPIGGVKLPPPGQGTSSSPDIDIKQGPIGGTAPLPVLAETPDFRTVAATHAVAATSPPATTPPERPVDSVQSLAGAIEALLNVIQQKNDKWSEISRAQVLLYKLAATKV